MKMTILICFFFFSLGVNAQNQNNVWYFGEFAGLDFATSPPSVLLDGALNHVEGVASISDINGNLYFYTNGITVWGADHSVIQNGSGLAGNNSSTQILIVPKPGNCNQFYIFTTPSQNTEVPITYSIVDMSANAGAGEVISKNVFVRSDVTEKISATLKSNGVDYWIIAQEWGSNAFLVYSLTASGFNDVPIFSFVGEPNLTSGDVVGCIAVSKDGKKIATASEIGHKKCQVFDFNNATGVVSNPIELNALGGYGVEFSADNTKLYFSKLNPFSLVQYDLSSGNSNAIINSKVVLAISSVNTENGGALQLAPDNKIYVLSAGKSFLDVIDNPNAAGVLSMYIPNGINLNNRKGYAGLPNFLKNYSQSTCGRLSARFQKISCDNFTITATASYGLAPYTFSRDGIVFQASNIFLNVPSGPYTITAKDANNVVKTFSISLSALGSPVVKVLSEKQPSCGNADGEITLTTEGGKPAYLYSNDGINFQVDSIFKNLNAGTKTFFVKDAQGCIVPITKTLNNINKDRVDAGQDTIIFINESVNLFAKDVSNSNFNSYTWSPFNGLSATNTQNTTAFITKDIEYTVIATNTISGCIATDKIFIKMAKDADIYVPTAFTPNNDRQNDVLRARPIGITSFKYFTLYNRYGQMIFTTTNANVGWDGKVGGAFQNTGTYVYITEGVDYTGRAVKKQGYVTLIR